MRQMCQCNQCQKLNPVNQGVCQQCGENLILNGTMVNVCLLYTSPSPRD